MKLNTLKPRLKQKRTRVGRGPGTGLGKTSGRGEKGAGSRSGYKRRYTYEGGQFRLFQKLPTRGFSRARFKKPLDQVNIAQLDDLFEDGDTITLEALKSKGLMSGRSHGVKLLAHGDTTKKFTIELHAYSKAAIEKLEKANINFKVAE